MKTIIKTLVCIYLALSCVWSVWYNVSDTYAWSIAANRNGLLCVGVEDDSVWVLSPFCNHGDVFLFGAAFDDKGSLHTFSDGLDCFGQWAVEDGGLFDRIDYRKIN